MLKNKSSLILIISSILLMYSCTFFSKRVEEKPVARVNETYLYEEDIKAVVPTSITGEDSLLLVKNYINNWATQQLLLQGASQNLAQEQQDQFNKLVEKYKYELYTKTYLDALVIRDLDTVIAASEIETYYKDNKEVFTLQEEILKFRYIELGLNFPNKEEIEKKFKRYNSNDKKYLDSIAIHFKSYALNDSVWVRLDDVIQKIPVLNAEEKSYLLKKSNFVQRKDSLGLYLMFTKNYLVKRDTAPLNYVQPQIKQILLNKRKLIKTKELKTDITKDAIKNKQFEIYK